MRRKLKRPQQRNGIFKSKLHDLQRQFIELGKRVGFRAAADAMKIVFDMLGIELSVPSHDAIEQWTLRLGVALSKDNLKKEERVLWMADHSSQIDKERLLLIVGVGLDDLPPPNQTLTFKKLKVLAMVPGQSWNKEDVEREYLKLAEQTGAPVYLLCNGAVELRELAIASNKPNWINSIRLPFVQKAAS